MHHNCDLYKANWTPQTHTLSSPSIIVTLSVDDVLFVWASNSFFQYAVPVARQLSVPRQMTANDIYCTV